MRSPPAPLTGADPADAIRRRYAPAQPALEAAMAATVWACAYPPAAHALQAWSRDHRTPATPGRWLPSWKTLVTGTPAERGMVRLAAARTLPLYHGKYPAGELGPPFGDSWSAGSPHYLSAAWTAVTVTMALSCGRHLDRMSPAGLDAWTRHHAETAARGLGIPFPPLTWTRLLHNWHWLLDERLARTAAGMEVLAGVIRAEDIGGWPGELLAARSRWLMPPQVTAALGIGSVTIRTGEA